GARVQGDAQQGPGGARRRASGSSPRPRALIMWVDQNAFGFLIVYFDVEEDEYALEREAFVERFEEFRRAVYDFVAGRSPGAGVRGLDLGHGIYFELESGDETVDPFVWARELRAALGEAGFVTAATITH